MITAGFTVQQIVEIHAAVRTLGVTQMLLAAAWVLCPRA